jgi:hypothetical protein
MEGICKLCGIKTTLLKESHILPDFIYRDLKMYNNDHIMHRIVVKKPTVPENKTRTLPTGEYEGGILCSNCDNVIIGSYETYAKKAMFGGELPVKESPIIQNFFTQQNIKYSHCQNIDYRKFKLFLLSILWRMCISSRPMFSQVEMGSKLKEKLRIMILAGDPGKINDFPIYAMTFLNDKSMPRDIIGQPFRAEVKGYTIIRILIGGIFLLFHLSTGIQDENKISNLVLNDKNEWNLFHIEIGQGWDFFFKHASM